MDSENLLMFWYLLKSVAYKYLTNIHIKGG